MRVSHIEDQSYVRIYILDRLYRGMTINVKEISEKFDYDESSVYKMLKRLNCNLAIIGSPYRVMKYGVSEYGFVKCEIDDINDG